MQLSMFAKVQKFVVKNAPTILAAMGAVGTVAAVILSSDSAIKAKQMIQTEEFKKNNEDICKKYLPKKTSKLTSVSDLIAMMDERGITTEERNAIVTYDGTNSKLSKADKLMIYAKAYAPTAVMTAASIVCIFGGNHISKQRIASLAGAYILKETAFEEYKQKAEDIIGKKKADDISDEIIQQHINNNPPTESNTIKSNIPNAVQMSLWYDETSNRYFYSNAEYIRRAELEANKMLEKNGFVGINDVYAILGLEEIPLGDNLGWDKEVADEVVIEIGSALLGPDVPCGTIKMEVHPTAAWLSEV